MPSYLLTLMLLAVAGETLAMPNGNTKSSSTSTSSATPTPHYYSLPQDARFDNDNNLGNPIVADEPVNIYDDLFFGGFTGIVDNDQAGIGILPQSPPNSIAYGTLLVGSTQGPPTMTTVYQDTTVDFFNLASLYYGCVIATDTGALTVLVSCNITATCVNPKGQQVAEQTFDFVANKGALSQQMVQVNFNGFNDCQSVNFNSTSPAGVTLATCFDTIVYTVFSQTPLSP